MRCITTQEYLEACVRVEQVMEALGRHYTPALEREMIELNTLIDDYENALEKAS